MKVNYLSDFKVTVTPMIGGVAVPIGDHDWELVFTSSGGSRRYVCSKRGGVWRNCRLGDDGLSVVCMLDSHGLAVGRLLVTVWDYSPDVEMPDGDLRTVVPSETDVELVVGAGDGSEVLVSLDVSPWIADLDERVTALEKGGGDVAPVVDALSERVTVVEGRLTQVEGATETLDTDVSAVTDSVVSLTDRVAAVETIAGGVPIVEHGSNEINVTIKPNSLHRWGEMAQIVIFLDEPDDDSVVNEYMIQFTSGSVATSLTLPVSVRWVESPIIDINKVYQISVVNGLAVITGWGDE